MPSTVAAILPTIRPVHDFGDDAEISGRDLFETFTYRDLLRLPEPIPLVDGLLFANTLAGLVGMFGSFKSFMALDLALCVATGREYHGRPVTQGSVLYVFAEGHGGLRRRLQAWSSVNGCDIPDCIRFVPQAIGLPDPDQLGKLRETLNALTEYPAFVIFDTVARCFRGDENSAADMGTFVEACDQVRQLTGACILLVHHMGWAAAHSRGSTVLPAALDTELTLTRVASSDRVTIRCSKQKDAEPFTDYEMEFFRVNNTSSGVLKPVQDNGTGLSGNALALLQALQRISNGAAVNSSNWETESRLQRSSYHYARNMLLNGAYVRRDSRGRYELTEGGRLYTTSACSIGPSSVQQLRGQPGHEGPTVSGGLTPEQLDLTSVSVG